MLAPARPACYDSNTMLQHDVETLRDFYATGLGQVVRRLLLQRIRARWRRVDGATVVGLGFASPYLGVFRPEAARVGAFMPIEQGALVWPSTGPRLSVLVEEGRLPLPDSSVDRLLVVHCLEMAQNAGPLLRELWRVLAPNGRLLIVVPNRRGIWARLDTTPFGQGRPYSRAQLEELLTEALFTPVDNEGALYMPPLDRPMVVRAAPAVERLGARLPAGFAGVILSEATKELIAPVGKAARAPARGILVPSRSGGLAHGGGWRTGEQGGTAPFRRSHTESAELPPDPKP